MSWETRGRSKFYYKVARNASGRLIKTYCGGGEGAKKAALADLDARKVREAEQNAVREYEASFRALDELINELDEAVAILVEASLLAAGFYKHHREWRRYGRKQNTPADACRTEGGSSSIEQANLRGNASYDDSGARGAVGSAASVGKAAG